eukprot:m.41909 g.41909  ORF g.41909 m.41909 type:complete len:334 (+) comp16928_c0_seq1:116-1117(+)
MFFTIDGQKYEFPCRYLGSVPVTKNTGLEVIKEADELLRAKLEKLQKRVVDRIVEKKHGTRLSSASPVWKKYAKQLRRQGKDVMYGDSCILRLTATDIMLLDSQKNLVNQFPSNDIPFSALYKEKGDGGKIDLFGVIVRGAEKNVCHIMTCVAGEGKNIHGTILESRKEGAREYKRKEQAGLIKKGGFARTKKIGDTESITVGVGIARKSAINVSMKLKRKDSVNLDGKNREGLVKRRSNSYGSTFASLGDDNTSNDNVSVNDNQNFQDDDDDLLDGVSEDWFEQGDRVSVNDTNSLDFDNFGFDDFDDLEDTNEELDDDDTGGFGFGTIPEE